MQLNTCCDEMVQSYLLARRKIRDMGFEEEVEWQEKVDFESISESDFISEAAWVILSSGMRESVIRKKWESVSLAFMSWVSCELITRNSYECKQNALRIFSHEGKISAIIKLAAHISDWGFSAFKAELCFEGVSCLQKFSYLGPATSYHLAKNIGMPQAKPDRHMKRIAHVSGYSSVQEMCEQISRRTGDKVSVIDLVLWRYATLEQNYLRLFTPEVIFNS